MLVLTRRSNQSIIIGKELITITILEIAGHQVRIGIDAPKQYSIHRDEIYAKIHGLTPPLSKPPESTKEPVFRTIDQPSLNESNQEGNQDIAYQENPMDIIHDLEEQNTELKERIEELEANDENNN